MGVIIFEVNPSIIDVTIAFCIPLVAVFAAYCVTWRAMVRATVQAIPDDKRHGY
jgi:hypothetical protein